MTSSKNCCLDAYFERWEDVSAKWASCSVYLDNCIKEICVQSPIRYNLYGFVGSEWEYAKGADM